MSTQVISEVELKKNKYISLKTFRKDSTPIITPVWFAYDKSSNKILMTTAKKAGKLKRLRNNNNVEFAFCNARGKIHSQYYQGSCKELSQNNNLVAHTLLKKKYGLLFRLWATFYLRKNSRTYLEMSVQNS